MRDIAWTLWSGCAHALSSINTVSCYASISSNQYILSIQRFSRGQTRTYHSILVSFLLMALFKYYQQSYPPPLLMRMTVIANQMTTMTGLLMQERISVLEPHFRSTSLTISMCFKNFVTVWNSKYNLVTIGCWILSSEKEHHSSSWHITVWIANIISVQQELQHLRRGSNQQAMRCSAEHIHHHILVDNRKACDLQQLYSSKLLFHMVWSVWFTLSNWLMYRWTFVYLCYISYRYSCL
jgi:hypothetical protein